METMTFSPEAIAETPSKYDSPKDELLEDLYEVEIILRATDLDNKKTGWAGKIEGKTERVKIELDPRVREADVFGKTKIVADVTIIKSVPRGKNEYIPQKIFVRKVYESDR